MLLLVFSLHVGTKRRYSKQISLKSGNKKPSICCNRSKARKENRQCSEVLQEKLRTTTCDVWWDLLSLSQ